MVRFYRRVSFALTGLYALWYFVLTILLPLPWILNGLYDDSFYYLQVARNVARGLGSTFDGQELTNGYHPLWMILLIPLHRLSGANLELPIHLALVLCALLGLGSLLWIRRILTKEVGWGAALCGLLLFAWPRFFGSTINLLESGLLLFLYLSLIALLLSEPLLRGRRLIAGLLLGLACLARLDSVFLLLSILCFTAAGARRRRPFWGDRWRRHGLGLELLPLILAGVLLAPYLLWNWTTFGHLQPISGAVKSSFPHPHPHWEYLWRFPEFDLLLVLGLLFAWAGFKREPSPLARTLGVFGLAALLHMLYMIFFMGWGVDRWYLGLLLPVGLLGVPWILTWMWRQGIRPLIPRSSTFLPRAVLTLGLACAIGVQAMSLRARPGRHLAAVRDVALWARDSLPPDAVFGMSDAGIFAYFSGRTTVNLDGLVNNFSYQEALKSGRVHDYLRARRIGYFLDCSAYGTSDLLSGRYQVRQERIWYHPEERVAGQISLYRSDEVHRVDLLSRRAPGLSPEPNALILYRYRPDGQPGP